MAARLSNDPMRQLSFGNPILAFSHWLGHFVWNILHQGKIGHVRFFLVRVYEEGYQDNTDNDRYVVLKEILNPQGLRERIRIMAFKRPQEAIDYFNRLGLGIERIDNMATDS